MTRGTALVTGASSGIGEAFARLLASEGFNLVLTARREDRLASLAEALAGDAEVTVIPADLASEAGVNGLCAQVEEQQIKVDVLINNAGVMIQDDFASLSAEQVDRTLALNIGALTRLTHFFLPAMQARKSGRILNVASIAAFHPVPGMDLYAATKAYVLSLTESLAENLRGTGVSVTALCPGLTETAMVDDSIAAMAPPFMIAKPAEVAREGFNAMMHREVIRVPGNANRLALTWAQHQPRWLVRGLGGLASRLFLNQPRPR